MIELVGKELYQWDTGRSVQITGIEADCAHFANKGDSKAPIMDIADSQAKIPDYLLQTGKTLCVYAVKNGITVESKTFYVQKRERPENYVYEDDQRNYIYELITNAETAIEGANTATASANQAAESANEAKDGANLAAKNANLAAKNANEASDKAAHTAKSLMVVGKTEGESIHLDDAIAQFFVGMRIFGKTTQEGTPTPDAPVDLVSVGEGGSICVAVVGKNLLAKPFLIGVHTTSGYNNYNKSVISTEGFFLKAGTYVVSGPIIDSWILYINGMTSTTTTSGYQSNYVGRVFTIPEDGLYNIQFNKSGGNTFTDAELQVLNNSVQVEIGSTPTVYEPYKCQTLTVSTPNGLPGISVSSGGNYTDENGQQWICDEIDFARGVYVQRIVHFSFAVADMNGSENYPSWTNAGIAKHYPDASNAIGRYGASAMCNIEANPNDNVHINTKDGKDVLMIPNPNGMTQSEWKTNYPDLVYELIVSIPIAIETALSAEELATYASMRTYRGNTTVSNDSSAHMEIEYVMDAKKYIDGLIGGINFAPRVVSVSLPASKWAGSGNLYSQVVSVSGITENSQVNLAPSVEQLSIFYEKDITFVTENDGGVVTVYVIGQKPQNDYTIQADIVEVIT